MTDKTREQFEHYAQSQGYADFETNEFGDYRNPHTQGRWNFWRAALAAPSAEPVAWLYHDATSLDALLAAEQACSSVHSVVVSLRRQPYYCNETPLYLATPAQPPAAQLDPNSDDAQGLAAPEGYWRGHNAAQDMLAPIIHDLEAKLATYRAESVALIARAAELEAENAKLRRRSPAASGLTECDMHDDESN